MAVTAFEQPDIEKVSILGTESIHVGFHLIPYIIHTVLSQLQSSTYLLITDTNLGKLYLPALENEFHSQAANVDRKTRLLSFQVAPGEEAKSRRQKELIEDFMLENKCTRDSVILALGGGVVGDLSGFVAATL
jgi:pentafunctional AROM polypeptide